MTEAHKTLYTIGHSTHAAEKFVALLREHGITAIADVRSTPFSRRNPQFNRERLKQTLQDNGIAYVFLGEELGARSKDDACYEDGKVQYDRLARTPSFQQGLARVREGMKNYRVALMCAEKEPLECHRTILVSRHLHDAGVPINHILSDGTVETHEHLLDRLIRKLKLPTSDLLNPQAVADTAYRRQAARVAYTRPEPRTK